MSRLPSEDNGRRGLELSDHGSKRRKLLDDDGDGQARGSEQISTLWTPRRRLPRHEYTIGWISALPLEMAAARAMMDEIHEDCGRTSHGDTNTYTLGTIMGHNCVIACLPGGVYGTTSTTAVANSMRFSFPSIQFWLMVGIGGGAPTDRNDIRLGDVVVSRPSPGRGAVIQYDYGKLMSGGRFEQTGTLNKPPPLLLTASAKLEAEYRVRKDGQIPTFIAEMLRQYPDMKAKYSHPGVEHDILFHPSYDHFDPGLTCRNCDKTQVKPRATRPSTNPIVHYGTIASGNQVIKDAKTRDKFSRELGILCFEMEAAGLMDNFPSIAIRGICDYADSHKSKQWQEYAAVSAAAYAKELLSVIPHRYQAKEVDSPRIWSEKTPTSRKELLESLEFDEIYSRHASIKTAHTQTCKWLFDNLKYQNWLNFNKYSEHHGFLWIKGKPGAGKSTIMKYTLENARKAMKNKEKVIISFFFNARGEYLENSTIGMYRSLLFQLLLAVPDLQVTLNSNSIAKGTHGSDWSIEILQNLFLQAIKQLTDQSVMCFIDALDECDEDEIRNMVDFLSSFGDMSDHRVSRLYICFSSRHYPHISLETGLEIILDDEDGHSEDLAKYLNSKLSSIKGKKIEEVKAEVLGKSSGIFLWVVLVVPILRKAYDHGRMAALRQKLREIPSGLNDLFKDILTRDRDNLEDLFVCLQWILYSKRPLTPFELFFAIQSRDVRELSSAEPPEDTESVRRFILSSSKGLAELSKSRRPNAQFIHESVRDYLLRDGGMQSLLVDLQVGLAHSSHDLLRHCCDNYMAMVVQSHPAGWPNLPDAKSHEAAVLRKEISEKFPLLPYVVEFLIKHADDAEGEGIQQDSWVDGFPLKSWIYLHNIFEKHQVRRYKDSARLVYILAENDLANLMKAGMQRGLYTNLNSSGGRYGSPIRVAFLRGSKGVLEILPMQQIEIFLQPDSKKESIIFDLIARVEPSILKPFLSLGSIDLEITGKKHGLSPLQLAAKLGKKEMVQDLIDAGADVEFLSKEGKKALWYVTGDAISIFVAPIKKGALVNPKDGNWERILFHCIEKKMYEETTILIDGGVDLECQGRYGCTPLLYAAYHNANQLVKTLIMRGADIKKRDDSGNTLLHHAASHDGYESLKLTLDHWDPTDLDVRNKYGETPLWTAVQRRTTESVQLLLQKGADVNAADILGWTSLHEAVKYSSWPIQDILFNQKDVNLEACDVEGRTPFLTAVLTASQWISLNNPYFDLVERFIVAGADITARDNQGKTALDFARKKGNQKLITLLLQ